MHKSEMFHKTESDYIIARDPGEKPHCASYVKLKEKEGVKSHKSVKALVLLL